MANKQTAVENLRNYCEKRWSAQDKYIDGCLDESQKFTIETGIVLFVVILGSIVACVSSIDNLQHRIDHIEQIGVNNENCRANQCCHC